MFTIKRHSIAMFLCLLLFCMLLSGKAFAITFDDYIFYDCPPWVNGYGPFNMPPYVPIIPNDEPSMYYGGQISDGSITNREPFFANPFLNDKPFGAQPLALGASPRMETDYASHVDISYDHEPSSAWSWIAPFMRGGGSWNDFVYDWAGPFPWRIRI